MQDKAECGQDPQKAQSPRIKNPKLFTQMLALAVEDPEFLPLFDKLTGHNLTGRGPAIIFAIDQATGHYEAGVREFYELVVKLYQQVEAVLANERGGNETIR